MKIRYQFKLDMAHQLRSAYTVECMSTIHGHTYRVEVFLKGTLDGNGMVLDFGDLKSRLRPFMNKWDHSLVMPAQFSSDYLTMLDQYNERLNIVPWNPTAENMAVAFLTEIADLVGPLVAAVRVHETEAGYAEAE